MTLDQATDSFRENPTEGNAARLIAVALIYARDGMIHDTEYLSIRHYALPVLVGAIVNVPGPHARGV